MNERGTLSLLLDDILLKYNNVDIYINKGVSNKYISIETKHCLNYINQPELHKLIDLSNLVKLTGHLSHTNDYNNLATLLDLAYSNKYLEYCNLFFSPFNRNINVESIEFNSTVNTHLLNNMIFLIRDKDLFIKAIEEKGYNVNQGPQRWRGHLNSINNLLNNLDSDYRESLYNHYIYHKNNNSLPEYAVNFPLGKEHFYFRNIHHHIGNIKW